MALSCASHSTGEGHQDCHSLLNYWTSFPFSYLI